MAAGYDESLDPLDLADPTAQTRRVIELLSS